MQPPADLITIWRLQATQPVQSVHRFLVLPLLFIITLGLIACSGAPERPGGGLDEAARPLVAQGDYLAAAQLYLSAAETAPENTRDALRLKAGGLLADAQQWTRLEQLLAGLRPAALEPALAGQYYLLAARRAMVQQQPVRALELLAKVPSPEAFADHGREYYQVRASAYARSGNPLEAARQLIWLDGLLIEPELQLDNQYRIWELLSSLSSEALKALKTAPPPDVLSGWMELLLITRESRHDRQHWSEALQRWRTRYPQHTADQALLPDLLQQTGQLASQAGQIAVLLPFSGPAGEAANAVRDGLLAAFYQNAQSATAVQFYDTAGDASRIWSIYQGALNDGADFVIGPLLKDSVQALSRSGSLAVPVLALNQIDAPLGAPDLALYQFGLAPEDEARQAAERAIADRRRRLVALIPDNAWGTRVYQAFREHYISLGGDLVAVEHYDSDSADFTQPIRRLFNLDDSRDRYQALQRLLGERLEFETRRRQDAQGVFVLAFARQARQIKPQLRFHRAGDLPVYSTSHVYQASDDPAIDRDMDGLMFCDIPWVLDTQGPWAAQRQQTQKLWPDRAQRDERLFALGFDAFQVVPWLTMLHLPGFAQFPGATGILTLDEDRHLHRALEWARFNRGTPELIEETPLTSMEGQHAPESHRQ